MDGEEQVGGVYGVTWGISWKSLYLGSDATVRITVVSFRLCMCPFPATRNRGKFKICRGELSWKLSREHLIGIEENRLRNIMDCRLSCSAREAGRVCMMSRFKSGLMGVSWERNFTWLSCMNRPLVGLVYKQVVLAVGLAIGMMGIVDRVFPIRIRQRRRHTSALLELESPGRMPNYI